MDLLSFEFSVVFVELPAIQNRLSKDTSLFSIQGRRITEDRLVEKSMVAVCIGPLQ
jgi:hypothetical protein